MKWRTEQPIKELSTRWRTVFLWKSRECRDGYTRWLEHADVYERAVETREYMTKGLNDFRKRVEWQVQFYDAPGAGAGDAGGAP